MNKLRKFFDNISCKSSCCHTVIVETEDDKEQDIIIKIEDGRITVNTPGRTPNTRKFIRRLKLNPSTVLKNQVQTRNALKTIKEAK